MFSARRRNLQQSSGHSRHTPERCQAVVSKVMLKSEIDSSVKFLFLNARAVAASMFSASTPRRRMNNGTLCGLRDSQPPLDCCSDKEVISGALDSLP